MQILPKIGLQSNIQYSQKNNNLNMILNIWRIYGSVGRRSDREKTMKEKKNSKP